MNLDDDNNNNDEPFVDPERQDQFEELRQHCIEGNAEIERFNQSFDEYADELHPDAMNDQQLDSAIRIGARSLFQQLGGNPSTLRSEHVEAQNEQDFGERLSNESDAEHLAKRSLPRRWQKEFAEKLREMLGTVTQSDKERYSAIIDEFKKWAVQRVHSEMADPANEKFLPDAIVQGQKDFQKLTKDRKQFYDWFHSYYNLDSAGNMIAKFYDMTKLNFDFRQYDPLAKLTDVVTKAGMKWDARQRPALLLAGPKSSGKTYMMTAISSLWFSGVHSHTVHQTSLALTAGGLHDLHVHSQDEAPPEMIGGGGGSRAQDVEQTRGNAILKAMLTNKLVTSTRLQQVDGKWKQVTYLSSHIGTFILATNLSVSTSENPTLARFIVVMVPQISSTDDAAIEKRIAQLREDDINEVKKDYVIFQQLTNWYLMLLELYIYVGIVQEVDMDPFVIQLQSFVQSMDNRGFLLQDPKKVVTLKECTRTLVVEHAVTMAMFSEFSYLQRRLPDGTGFYNYFEHPEPLYFINIMEQFLVCTTSIAAFAFTMLSVLWSNPATMLAVETVRDAILSHRMHIFSDGCFSSCSINDTVPTPLKGIDTELVGQGDSDDEDVDDDAEQRDYKRQTKITIDKKQPDASVDPLKEKELPIEPEKAELRAALTSDPTAPPKLFEDIDRSDPKMVELLKLFNDDPDYTGESDDDDDTSTDIDDESATRLANGRRDKRKRSGAASATSTDDDGSGGGGASIDPHSTSPSITKSTTPPPPPQPPTTTTTSSTAPVRPDGREKLAKKEIKETEPAVLQNLTYKNDEDRIKAKMAEEADRLRAAADSGDVTSYMTDEAELKRVYKLLGVPFKLIYREQSVPLLDLDYIELRTPSSHMSTQAIAQWIVLISKSGEKASPGNIETVLKDMSKSEVSCPAFSYDKKSKQIVAGKRHTIAMVQLLKNSRQLDPHFALGHGVRVFMSTYYMLNGHSVENAMIGSLMELGFETSMPLNVITNFTAHATLYRAPPGMKAAPRMPLWGVYRTAKIPQIPGKIRIFVNPKKFTERMLTLYDQASGGFATTADLTVSLTTCAPSMIIRMMPEFTSCYKHKLRCGIPHDTPMLSDPYMTDVWIYQIRRMIPKIRKMQTFRYPHALVNECRQIFNMVNRTKIYNNTELQHGVAQYEDSMLTLGTPTRQMVPLEALVRQFNQDRPYHRTLRGFLSYSNMPNYGKDARKTLEDCIERFENPQLLRDQLEALGVNKDTLMMTDEQQRKHAEQELLLGGSGDNVSPLMQKVSRTAGLASSVFVLANDVRRRAARLQANGNGEDILQLDRLAMEDGDSNSGSSSSSSSGAGGRRSDGNVKLTSTAFDRLITQMNDLKHFCNNNPEDSAAEAEASSIEVAPSNKRMDSVIGRLTRVNDDTEFKRIELAVGALLCEKTVEEKGSIEADERRLQKEEEDRQLFLEKHMMSRQQKQDTQNHQSSIEAAIRITKEAQRFNKEAAMQTRRANYEATRDVDVGQFDSVMRAVTSRMAERNKQLAQEQQQQQQQNPFQQQFAPAPPRQPPPAPQQQPMKTRVLQTADIFE